MTFEKVDEIAAFYKVIGDKTRVKILYVLVEKLYIDTVKTGNVVPCDIEAEEMKLAPLKDVLKVLY